jgi:hypothetical protein
MSETITAVKAARDLQALMLAMQRGRSAVAEARDPKDAAIARATRGAMPWLTGDEGDSLILMIGSMLDDYDATGTMPGSGYANIVKIVNHVEPGLRVMMICFAEYVDFPRQLPPSIGMETLRR